MTELFQLIEYFKLTNRTEKLIGRSKRNFNNCLDELISLTSWLITDNIQQRLYHLINNNEIIPICPYCKIDCKFHHIIYGYRRTCHSKECMSKLNVDSTKAGMMKKYGVDNISKLESIKEKKKKTMFDRYGTKHPTQNIDIKNKKYSTNLERYGVENPLSSIELRERGKLTRLERYGDKNYNNIEKRNITNLERYGEVTPLILSMNKDKTQDDQLSGKTKIPNNSFKFKPYIFPSGKTILVQGYEGRALDILLKEYSEDDIITSHSEMQTYIGIIRYFHEDKSRKYFPDIYIKSTNTIVEVKSAWTMEKNLERNQLKQQASLDAGFNFKFMLL